MSSVPRREILDKENMLDPGPWTSKPHKGHTAAVPVSRPQQPPFKCDNPFCLSLSFCVAEVH